MLFAQDSFIKENDGLKTADLCHVEQVLPRRALIENAA